MGAGAARRGAGRARAAVVAGRASRGRRQGQEGVAPSCGGHFAGAWAASSVVVVVVIASLVGLAALLAGAGASVRHDPGDHRRPGGRPAGPALVVGRSRARRGRRRSATSSRPPAGSRRATIGARVRGAARARCGRLARAFNAMSARLERDASRAATAPGRCQPRAAHAADASSRATSRRSWTASTRPTAAHLEPILEETHLLERLIEDLRTLSLAETGRPAASREPTDLARCSPVGGRLPRQGRCRVGSRCPARSMMTCRSAGARPVAPAPGDRQSAGQRRAAARRPAGP